MVYTYAIFCREYSNKGSNRISGWYWAFKLALLHDKLINLRQESPKVGIHRCEITFTETDCKPCLSSHRYKLDKATIVTELKNERPQWILSAFGPAKDIPIQLFGGYPREQSCEELRLRHYELAAAGNAQQAIQEAQTWFNNAEQQIRTALDDVEGAINYMSSGENVHPNRFDICNAKGSNLIGTQPSAPAFGQPTSTPTAPKAGFGGLSTTFAQPTSTSSFGQPPTFGQQASNSAFGQPSQLGRPATSFGNPNTSFGQPSAPAPAFGKPTNIKSAFGQSQAAQPAFGQTSFGQPSAPSAFGQKSTFSAFGAPSTLGSNQQSTFGQAIASQQSDLGQPSSGASQQNAFGQSSNAPKNPFAQASQPTNTSILPATTNPFGQPARNQSAGAFGQASSTATPFGVASTQPSNATAQTSMQPSSGFGQPSALPNSTAAGQHPVTPTASHRAQVPATRDAQGKLKTWKGKPVTYVDNEPCTRGEDGAWEKVCFPNGPPTLTKAAELADDVYDESTKENYMFMRTHGVFKDGVMPSLPPKREWCSWDF